MKVGIFNNTGLKRKHYGSFVTCMQLEKIVGKFAEVEFFAAAADEFAHSRIKDVDVVLINGEGTFHSVRYQSLLLYHILYKAKFHNKKCYLVNTSIQNLPDYFDLDDFDYIFVREKYSLIEAQKHTKKVKLVFDTCFTYNVKIPHCIKDGFVVLDHVDDLVSGQLMQYSDGVLWQEDPPKYKFYSLKDEEITEKKLIQFLQKLNRAEHIFSGRYHGVCFAIMLGVSVSAVNSNTWKIEGLLDYFGLADKVTTKVIKLDRTPYQYTKEIEKEKIIKSYKELLCKN